MQASKTSPTSTSFKRLAGDNIHLLIHGNARAVPLVRRNTTAMNHGIRMSLGSQHRPRKHSDDGKTSTSAQDASTEAAAMVLFKRSAHSARQR
jgi:hypothetical protein